MRPSDPLRRRMRSASTETTEQALRRLLARYYAQVRMAEPATAAGSDEGLHDLRVGLRKVRNVALLFHDADPKFLGGLQWKISRVSDRMGEARDLDVWRGLFHEMERAGGLQGISRLDHLSVGEGLLQQRDRLVSAAMADPLYLEIKQQLRGYVRLCPKPKKSFPLPPVALAARQILAVRELIDSRYRRVGHFSCDRAHQLRKAGRRMRYLGEFYAEEIGSVCVKAIDAVTRAQSALGKVHDCDSALELSAQLPTGRGREIVRAALQKRRAAFIRKFETAWQQYADRRLQQDWRKQLEAAAAT